MILPGLVLVLSVNGAADYLNNRGETERRMVRIIVGGSYVTGLDKYNDRLFQKLMVEEGMDNLPEEIVLGSSRAMQITHEFSHYDRFYNSALFGGYLDDMVAVYGLYEEAGAPLKRVVIGIDPWIFRGEKVREYRTLAGQYRSMAAKIGVLAPRSCTFWDEAGGLVCVSRVGESFRNILRYLRPEAGMFVATRDSLNTGATEYPDGSYSVTEAERNASREELTHFDVNRHLDKNFTQLSKYEQELFMKFVGYLKNKGIEVVLVFAPYHPVVWERVKISDRMVLETERVVREFAAESNIEVLGTYDPTVYDLDVMAFINGGHPKKEVFYHVYGER